MIIVAITGASGVIYGVELLKALKELDIETGLLISDPAKIVIEYELEQDLDEIKPCSMKTLSAIANAYASNAITRVADVALKERRNLVIVPRETPLRTTHLENMARISHEGGIILPAMPAFYHNPQSIDDVTHFIVGKILDVLNIDNEMFQRWKKE